MPAAPTSYAQHIGERSTLGVLERDKRRSWRGSKDDPHNHQCVYGLSSPIMNGVHSVPKPWERVIRC